MRTCMRETQERGRRDTQQGVRVRVCIYELYHVPNACTHVEAEE